MLSDIQICDKITWFKIKLSIINIFAIFWFEACHFHSFICDYLYLHFSMNNKLVQTFSNFSSLLCTSHKQFETKELIFKIPCVSSVVSHHIETVQNNECKLVTDKIFLNLRDTISAFHYDFIFIFLISDIYTLLVLKCF